MKVFINEEEKNISLASISTLLDVVNQIEVTQPQGSIITEITLNDKPLESNWYQNASKIYLLDSDKLYLKIEESTKLASSAIENSKVQFEMLLVDFVLIAKDFRTAEYTAANEKFIQAIENLQWFLKVLEDATFLLGRPIDKIKYNDVFFMQYISELTDKLDKVINTQSQQDWVKLADMIEYEMLPALKKIAVIYNIVEV